MQITSMAIAISLIVGAGSGAGATAIAMAYTTPACSSGMTDAAKDFSRFRPVPTTGGQKF
jgi:hypothetical protein